MKLKCKIKNKNYPIVQGVTFSEEYNETLDSGSIIITHVSKVRNLKPYDDVYIYDNEFNGFYWDDKKEIMVKKGENKFYKHMLVQNFTEEILNLKDGIYKYTVSLMSEIKFFEKIQLPNISITQPLNKNKKISIYEYLDRFVKMYSPKIKVAIDKDNKKWEYQPKYRVDPKLKDIFGDTYSPDFSLNLPSLRDVLSQLMIVKDMIPYVEDNVVKAMDITLRKKEFNLDVGHMNYITGTMNSDNYCTALKRTYSEALSQNGTCRFVEQLGFRNSDAALMTIENMRLETRFPIYKINKIYMCYYKESSVHYLGEEDYPSSYHFLCKQDITPLVKLNTERMVLSKDWMNFKNYPPLTVEELAEYKICTVGYDIGSNYITGWGEKQSVPKGWWNNETFTVIQNILNFMDYFYDSGINSLDDLMSDFTEYQRQHTYIENRSFRNELPNLMGAFAKSSTKEWFNHSFDEITRSILNVKGITFEIDYQGFYNGTIVHSKDLADDDYIITNDNASSSLTLLEKDGLSQKEKVNRLGNKTLQISARYNNIEDMQELGDVYNNEDDTDVIIYHREYSIYDNMINVIYFGAKDYVLKNYYTSVFARHRTWNLMSYGESVRRSENEKKILILSKNNSIFEKTSFLGTSFDETKLLSCFLQSSGYNSTSFYETKDQINVGYFSFKTNNNPPYDWENVYTDVHVFASGNSLVFNICMTDNISMGTRFIPGELNPFDQYVTPLGLEPDDNLNTWLFNNDDYTGTKTHLVKVVDDDETGEIGKVRINFAHTDEIESFKLKKLNNAEVESYYEHNLALLPVDDPTTFNVLSHTNRICFEKEFYKDNKEQLDVTFQIEALSMDKNVIFSDYFFKANELLGKKFKTSKSFIKDYDLKKHDYIGKDAIHLKAFCGTTNWGSTGGYFRYPTIVLELNTNDKERLFNLLQQDSNGIATNRIVIRNMQPIDYPINIIQNSQEYGTNLVLSATWEFEEIATIDGIEEVNAGGAWEGDDDMPPQKFRYIDIIAKQTLQVSRKSDNYSIKTYVSQEKMRFYKLNDDNDFKDKKFYSRNFELFNDKDNNEKPFPDDKSYYEFRVCPSSASATHYFPYKAYSTIQTKDENFNTVKFPIVQDNISDENSLWLNNGYLVYHSEDGNAKNDYEEITVIASPSFDPKTKYYPKNMFVVTSNNQVKNTHVYDEYLEDKFPYTIHEIDFESVFKINKSASNEKNIEIDKKIFDIIGKWEFNNEANSDIFSGELIHSIEFEWNNTQYIGIKRNANGFYFITPERKYHIYNSEHKTIIFKRLTTYHRDYNLYNWLQNNAVKVESEYDVKSIQYWYKEVIDEGTIFNLWENLNLPEIDVSSNDNITLYMNFRDGTNDVCSGITVQGTKVEGYYNVNQPRLIFHSVDNNDKIVYYYNEYTEKYEWLDDKYRELSEVCYSYSDKESDLQQQNIANQIFKKKLLKNITNDNNILKFVFGVNLTEEDKGKDNIQIYASLISNRDVNVYDENHNVIGKVKNYLDENNTITYGVDQYYDDIIE